MSRVGAPGRQAFPSVFAAGGSWGEVDAAFVRVWRSAASIPGWLSEEQARALFRAAACVPAEECIVEIGSHCGRSTVFLASAKRCDVHMLAVDPFDDPHWGGGSGSRAAFECTLREHGLADVVETFRGVSSEASESWQGTPIGLLFVDGAHDRPSVRLDIEGWHPFVAPGGTIYFHDAFSSPGVTRALTEWFLVNPRYRYIGSERTLVGFVRERTTGVRLVVNRVRLALRYAYFARNVAIKLSLRRRWTLPLRLLRHRGGDDPF